MKLAKALMERKAIKTKMEDLKKRIYQNASIQEGDRRPTLFHAYIRQALAVIKSLCSNNHWC